MDLLLPIGVGASVSADWLATLQARGCVPVCRPLHHHLFDTLDEHCASHAGHAVLLWGGDSQRSGLFLLHLQVKYTNLKSTSAHSCQDFSFNTFGQAWNFEYVCYSVIDLKRYRKATSYCRSVQLLGYTVGSVLGQLFVSFDLMSYNNIVVFTLVLTSIALLFSCLLPMPQQSMFFHSRQKTVTVDMDGHEQEVWNAKDRVNKSKASPESLRVERDGETEGEKEPEAEEFEESVSAKGCSEVLLQLYRDFRLCYSSRKLLYWSVWWAMATCGYNQTGNYVQVCKESNKSTIIKMTKCPLHNWSLQYTFQVLWEHVQPSQNFSIYNGGVEAVSNLLGKQKDLNAEYGRHLLQTLI